MKSAVSVLKDDGNDTKAIKNFINGNRLLIAINEQFFVCFCPIYKYPSFISMFSVLY